MAAGWRKKRPKNAFSVTLSKQYYRALRPIRPLVTTCCGSLDWINTCSEDEGGVGGCFCRVCKKLVSVEPISLEQYNKHYTNVPLTKELFDSLWRDI